ncbi:MAG: aldose 1-epimerase [Ignavibacteriales bacterium]|nr:aldose 1-epimerase [Ignavibacteriales bacterium]
MPDTFVIQSRLSPAMLDELIIQNSITGEYISIIPALGARLNAAYLLSKKNLIPVLCELSSSNLTTNDNRFNNAKLFPFAGRIAKGSYAFEGEDFQLPLNYPGENNACHGFLFDKVFRVAGQEVNKHWASVTLVHTSEGTFPGYPFPFTISVTYSLDTDGAVLVTTLIKNTSSKAMLFSDGWHPYYCIGDSIDNLQLEANVCEKIELDNVNIPDNRRVQLNSTFMQDFTLAGKEYDNVYRFNQENEANTINLVSEVLQTKLSIWHESGVGKYNYLVIYTPPGRKYIAIEPYSANINSFNNKEGLIYLNPRQEWSASYGFCLTDITQK